MAAGLSNPPTLRGVWGGVGEIRVVDKALRALRSTPSQRPRTPRPRGRRIREACGHFRRPRKKKLQHSESCAATKQTQALYWLRLPASVQMWFETTRFVYFVKLKHASRTFFDLKLQRTAFHSKNTPKKCSQSSPRAPKTSPKCLQELPGDLPGVHLVL